MGLGFNFEDDQSVTASRDSAEAAKAHEMLRVLKTAHIQRLALYLPSMAEGLAKSALASHDELHGGRRRRDKARRE